MSFERLQDKIREMKNPTVAGLDPKLEYVPSFIVEEKMKQYGQTLRCAAEAIYEYNVGLIDALCDVVPAVKPQSAFYERFGFEGVEVLKRTVDYAKSEGIDVIMDAKRGDIGSTAEGYSEAYLGSVTIGETEVEPFGCDCLTINAYLGSDGINPFIKDCVARDRAVFALVKTSNPGSGELQNIVAGDRKVYNVVGDLLERLSKDTVDKYGYTCVGAVTGATYPWISAICAAVWKRRFSWCPAMARRAAKQKMCSMLSMNMVTEPSSILPEASSAPGRKPEKRERILAKQPGMRQSPCGKI